MSKKIIRISKDSIQPAVKIDKLLNDDLTEWLKTDYAKGLGFHSKAHFITNAARDLLFRYRTQKYMNVVKHDGYFTMKDLFYDRTVEVVVNLSEYALECPHCSSGHDFRCDHIYTIWQNARFAVELMEERILNPFDGQFGETAALIIRK